MLKHCKLLCLWLLLLAVLTCCSGNKKVEKMSTNQILDSFFNGITFDGIDFTVDATEYTDENTLYKFVAASKVSEEQIKVITKSLANPTYKFTKSEAKELSIPISYKVSSDFDEYISYFISQKTVDGNKNGTTGYKSIVIDYEKNMIYLEYLDPINQP